MPKEYIEREAAIDAMTADNLLKHFDSVEDVIEKRFHRAAERILVKIPAADVVERPKWIPVTERLPELPRYEYCSKMVIAKASGFGVMPMAYERTKLKGKVTERWRFYWDRVCTEEVTHWMPLPEPPKEEKK